ncbi:4-hydroxybenzoate octaprenyltransferase [Psychromonas ingrahamii 37]|uniref:4-hydroxybenzoate octaprenyltransferase n=1 Tax=Psychromonas ingrahamii (strain DSM 17664 / CCUG 51855 / 37) TaxID=357804 RepID=UBIA_PSYIN|nr:4-hydroxybenzoate octaprenyltransferase [Psychromonas ingrahamii]A1T087.1 RecName: Full=4-hydroxybenzoate octaprenyltransferase; AltName: Full=4-HB polyprenyltransferase [Psychromonas ingrahamii 37]ABM05152.1 4-hydroxybenzoate octaprenyltransferase [Psychromonas ingrahamii 37]
MNFFCKEKRQAYVELMRINKPIGTLLLLWPTLWALWIAAQGFPDLGVLIVFSAGVFLMRSAGCVINDFADRNIDGFVERTKHRPLPSGRATSTEAIILFFILAIVSFLLVLTQNSLTIQLSFAGLLLAFAYPFMKRFTQLPQLVLGLAFSWSIPMAFAAQANALPAVVWIIFAVNIIWTIAYDTLYAMVDREDDLKIGVKSTAILFASNDKIIIALLQLTSLILLSLLGWLEDLNWIYFIALLVVGGLFLRQQLQIKNREKTACFKAFLDNNYVGFVIFAGLFLGYL